MNKYALSKQVHKTMRDAGFERQSNRIWVGNKIYRSMHFSSWMWIYIPGYWSIPILKDMREQLMTVLERFNPESTEGSPAGVKISYE